jgi:hypothetical protein
VIPVTDVDRCTSLAGVLERVGQCLLNDPIGTELDADRKLAGVAFDMDPRWLSWGAVIVGVLQLTPLGFTGYLVFLLWTLAAGITMVLRPTG